MSSDQTLVMINGKRRHRSALVQFLAPAAGNGAHGPDVGMIPSIAIKSVEVLRDGAAAQYGSDAIAGVINFNLKDASDGGSIVGQWGQYYQGERSYKVAANIGLPVGDVGFMNFSMEYVDNQALSRGFQVPAAQALIDDGVQGVGSDSPFGDAPLVQSWGRPETSGLRLFLNSGFQVSDNADFYLHGNYADTDGRYRFFYRHPTTHSALIPLRDQGYTGLPAGFTPFLDGAQQDLSAVAGVKGDMEGDIYYDVSIGFGENKLNYFLNNSVNPDLGLVNGQIPKMDFDVGAYEQKEVNVNADFSKALNETFNIGFGGEWRKETYTVVAGEPDSYQGGGSSGLKGFTPQDAGAYSRNNYGVYVDLEQEVNDKLLLQYAGRFENYSDFGGTLNGKIAARYNVSDSLTLRGAASTGFHAPTPGQANVRTTITTFDGVSGLQVEEGLLPPTSPQAVSVGGEALKEETSVNYSLGFASFLGENTTLTVDLYQATVNDRIYKTGDIALPGSTSGATVAFYTNALDIRHRGLDLVLTSTAEFDNNASMDISLAANYNKVDVLRQNQIGGITPVSAGNIEDVENNFPKTRFVLSTNTHFMERWNFMARVNYYGSHYDERGTIGAATNPSYKIGSTFYVDLELGFQVNEELRLVAGGVNVLNSFVDEIDAPWSNRQSAGLPYPRRSAANYEGGSWYLRAQYNF